MTGTVVGGGLPGSRELLQHFAKSSSKPGHRAGTPSTESSSPGPGLAAETFQEKALWWAWTGQCWSRDTGLPLGEGMDHSGQRSSAGRGLP